MAPRVPGSREELELKLAEANKKVLCLWPVQWDWKTGIVWILNGQKQIGLQMVRTLQLDQKSGGPAILNTDK